MRSGIRNLDKGLKALEAYKKRYRKSADQAARELLIEITRATVLLTRVDTGRLVQGWQFSVNTPSTDSPNKESFQSSLPEGAKVSYQSGRANQLIGEIAGFNPSSTLSVDRLYLVNNVKYASYIENGTPTIPARMMLKRGIESGLSSLRKKLRES